MIRLQPRDRKIIRICDEHQFLLGEHVEAFFSGRGKSREARRRTTELVEAGLIRRIYSPVLGQQAMLRLTAAGQAVAETEREFNIRRLHRLNQSTVVHDGLVTSVRLRLERIWRGARYLPERAIKEGDYPVVPDGVFYFDSGRGIAIEVENSDKGKSRFLKLAARWSEVASIRCVLYVARDESLAAMLRKYLSNGPEAKPLALIDWPALRDGVSRPWTIRGEIPLFEREGF